MQRSIFKPKPTSEVKPDKTSTFKILENADFQTMLSNRLENLSLSSSSGNDTSAPNSANSADDNNIESRAASLKSNSRSDSRSGSVKNPLSRLESRQNSVLSILINPKDESYDTDATNASQNQDLRFKIYNISDLIKSLKTISLRSSVRKNIGSLEKEIILSHLYRMIVSNNENFNNEFGFNEIDFMDILNIDISKLGSFEWDLWIKCIVSYSCIGVDDVANDVINELFPQLLKNIDKIKECGDAAGGDDLDGNAQHIIDYSIWSFMSLLLFIFFKSENYKILQNAKIFLYFLQIENLPDKIVSDCIYSIGLCLSLAWESNRILEVREFIEDEVLEIIKILLNNKQLKNSQIAISVLAGLCFEIITSIDTDEDEDDMSFIYEEFDIITLDIEQLSNEGTKKTGKKEKGAFKDTKNIYKYVLNILTKQQNAGDDEDTEFESISITKNKNLKITSCFSYIRFQILKFVFGNQLHNWILNSRDVKGMLKMSIKNSSYSVNDDYDVDYDDDLDDDLSNDALKFRDSGDFKSKKDLEKERTKRLNKLRKVKEDELNE